MKNLLISVSMVFLVSGSAFSADQNFAIEKPELAVTNAWSYYSAGLYYKTLVAQNPSDLKSFVYIDLAIQYFNDALKYGEYVDGIYFQLSECYFMKFDYAKSLDYAYKSIEINKVNLKPYNRIFNIYMRNKEYDKAAYILEEYMKVQPDAIYVQFVLAEHYYRTLQNLEKATVAFKAVLDIYSKVPVEDFYAESSNYYLGYIAYREKKTEEAITYITRVYDMNNSNLDAIYMLSILNMDQYRFTEAERYATLYLKSSPQNSKMLGVVGRVKYIRDESGAVRNLRLAKNEGSIDGILARGLYDELMNKDDEAERILKAVLRSGGDMITPHIALSKIYLKKNDKNAAFNELLSVGVLMYNNKLYNDAAVYLTTAASLKSDVPELYYYIGRVYEETGSTYLAISNYKKALSLKNDIDLLLHIGYLYGIKKDYASAINYFNRASSADPKSPKPYFYKGLIQIWSDDYNTAEANIQQAINIEQNSEMYYFYMAVVQEKKKNIDAAISSLEKAIKSNPKSARAYNYLGYIYAEQNIKIDESYDLIQKALAIEPENGAFLDSLGWVYFRKGKYEEALDRLLKAEKKLKTEGARDAVVYDHIGDTYEKLGNIEMALESWSESIKLDKSQAIEKKIKKYKTQEKSK